MNIEKRYSRGAEWRKWDLHFHAPSAYTCAKQDEYSGTTLAEKQNQFIDELKEVKDVSVIGITDYFSLEGYKYVISRKSELPQFDLILPNIELRISPVTSSSRKINLHIIPNTEILSIEDIERFLYKFEFGTKKLTCQKEDLIELGRISDKDLSNQKAFTNGLNDFVITYEKFFEVYDSSSPKIKENILIGVSNNSTDGASGIKDVTGIRDIIYRGVHFIFSAQPSDRKYFLGQSVDDEKKIIDKYGSLKPCIHGSDYHGSGKKKKICVPDLNRFCWIKAEPNFNGLKQVLIEPEDRVFIGEEPEIQKRILANRTKYIKSISVNPIKGYDKKFGGWFDSINIPLNSELVVIIGNKGSGKSALADIISLCGNFKGNTNDYSFLHTKKFNDNNSRIAKNFEAILEWESGNHNSKLLSNVEPNGGVESVKYLPQGYFEKLTNEISSVESFRNEIEGVVFTHLEEDIKVGVTTFDELINRKKEVITHEINVLKERLSKINESIFDKEKKLNPIYRKKIEAQIEGKTKELDALIKPQDVINPNQDSNQTAINLSTNEEIRLIKEKVSELELDISKVQANKRILLEELQQIIDVKKRFESKIEELDFFRASESVNLAKFEIKFDDIFKYSVDYNKIDSIIQEKTNELNNCKLKLGESSLTSVDGNESLVDQLQKKKNHLKVVQDKLSEPDKKYQTFLAEMKVWEDSRNQIIGDSNQYNTLEYHKSQLRYIETQLLTDIDTQKSARFIIVQMIFDKMISILDIYKTIKSRIDTIIAQNSTLLESYKINIDASLDIKPNFYTKFLGFISLNRVGTFLGKENAEIQIRQIVKNVNFDDYEQIKECLNNIVSAFFEDKKSKTTSLTYIENQVDDVVEMYNYLFSLDFLDYNYDLRQGNKKLEQLSPGERGALLLIFYLLLDNNNTPLIIDQPEDNLDNNSVANVLVPFIKQAKIKRQIILVTHNPNLAVVADAEQIIYVELDKEKENSFSFISGAIENTEINKCIVKVLEGAMPAFNKRKQKYYE